RARTTSWRECIDGSARSWRQATAESVVQRFRGDAFSEDGRVGGRGGRATEGAAAAGRRCPRRDAALSGHSVARAGAARWLLVGPDVLRPRARGGAHRRDAQLGRAGVLRRVQPLLRSALSLRLRRGGLLRQPRALRVLLARDA